VEIGDARLVGIQKRIIQRARSHNKLVITATQMMESMINSPLPTRAEVSDVANAVLDYTDAVMLSAESATGKYPVEAVQAMARVCLGAEQESISTRSQHRLGETFTRCDETIALSSMYAANHFPGVKAIISLTESGHTPLIMSRIRSGVPIYCYTPHADTQRRAALFRGVYTVPFDASTMDPSAISDAAIGKLKSRSLLSKGDWIILTKGDSYSNSGGTNGMKILKVK
jgi:pyruvate kinase